MAEGESGILNRAVRCQNTLTRAVGAASPATKRARRIVGGAERHALTRTLTFILSLRGRGDRLQGEEREPA
jgi:hypothetical protein